MPYFSIFDGILQIHLIVPLALRISALTPGSTTLAGFLHIFFANEKSAWEMKWYLPREGLRQSGSINNFQAGFDRRQDSEMYMIRTG